MSKYVLTCIIALIVFAAPDIVGAVNFGLERVDDSLKGADIENAEEAVTSVVDIIAYLVGLFYLIAVILGIYAGFLIMTSAGDDERVKKGKNIFIYVIIGLIVVFLASTVIRFVIEALS